MDTWFVWTGVSGAAPGTAPMRITCAHRWAMPIGVQVYISVLLHIWKCVALFLDVCLGCAFPLPVSRCPYVPRLPVGPAGGDSTYGRLPSGWRSCGLRHFIVDILL